MAEKPELLKYVYLTKCVRVRKYDGKFYVETSFDGNDTATEIDFTELSRLSRQLSLMVYEQHNPDHYDIQPCGFNTNSK